MPNLAAQVEADMQKSRRLEAEKYVFQTNVIIIKWNMFWFVKLQQGHAEVFMEPADRRRSQQIRNERRESTPG